MPRRQPPPLPPDWSGLARKLKNPPWRTALRYQWKRKKIPRRVSVDITVRFTLAPLLRPRCITRWACTQNSWPTARRMVFPVFDQAWKNVVATFYHELNEARTDPDVEDAIRAGNDPNAVKFLGWTSQQGEECGDFPVFEANPLTEVFQEVPVTDGSRTVPVQFQYSDAVHGPEGPVGKPEVLNQAATA